MRVRGTKPRIRSKMKKMQPLVISGTLYLVYQKKGAMNGFRGERRLRLVVELIIFVRHLLKAGTNLDSFAFLLLRNRLLIKCGHVKEEDDSMNFGCKTCEAGIAVMGNVGLTPQAISVFGGFKPQREECSQRHEGDSGITSSRSKPIYLQTEQQRYTQIAVIGRPNVGKLRLLNSWTRDVVEANIMVHGVPITLFDTAGITEYDDIAEKIGVHRSDAVAMDAEVVIMGVSVIDGWTIEEGILLDRIKHTKFVKLGSDDVVKFLKMDLVKECLWTSFLQLN
ncbi:tRNA modification GTPase [Tanacetum coccineum]